MALDEGEHRFAPIIIQGDSDILAAQSLFETLSKLDDLSIGSFHRNLYRKIPMSNHMKYYIEGRFVCGIVIIEGVGGKFYTSIHLDYFILGILETDGYCGFLL